jgi:TetR/AcrR family transcriptional regulator, repressor for neighboring sulfatase
MTPAEDPRAHRPGPKRPPGSPSGPEEVRRAVLDAAALLFAERGIDRVSMHDISDLADVHVALIRRYIGNREELVLKVFDDLSVQLAALIAEHPLSGQPHGPETVMGKWVRMAGSFVISGRPLVANEEFNPVQAMAGTIVDNYGLDPRAARLRAAQIVAAALGWRIFENYLVQAGELGEVPIETLRDELARSARRLGATPWPSPPDPAPRWD